MHQPKKGHTLPAIRIYGTVLHNSLVLLVYATDTEYTTDITGRSTPRKQNPTPACFRVRLVHKPTRNSGNSLGSAYSAAPQIVISVGQRRDLLRVKLVFLYHALSPCRFFFFPFGWHGLQGWVMAIANSAPHVPGVLPAHFRSFLPYLYVICTALSVLRILVITAHWGRYISPSAASKGRSAQKM